MDFIIDTKFLRTMSVKKEWNIFTQDGRVPTAEETMLILQGKGFRSLMATEETPEFSMLRNQLEDNGYIITSRNSWNGDYVRKPFTLNGYPFEVNEKFPSGSVIDSMLRQFNEDYGEIWNSKH